MSRGKILILGRDGMLGSMLCTEVEKRSLEFVATSRHSRKNNGKVLSQESIRFDVDNDDIQTLLGSLRDIKYIINCIGIVKQSKHALNEEYMYRINGDFPIRLGQRARVYGAKVIHLSTDCVFSGIKGDYTETDIPDAKDDYGLSKLAGEKIVQESAMVIRTSMIGREIGPDKKGLVEWLLSMRGKKVQGYKNVFFSGLTTRRLSRIIIDLLNEDRISPGIWHISSEKISKYDLLNRINLLFDLGVEILPSEEPTLDRSLNSSKSSRLLGTETPDWDSMLSDEDWSKNN